MLFKNKANHGTPGSSDEVVDANYGVHRGSVAPASNFDVDKTEAPVTVKAYLACAFAAFGGIFFGYDSGYISGVMGMEYVKVNFWPHGETPGHNPGKDPVTGVITPSAVTALPSSTRSLITSILSAGTFIGAVLAGDLADWYGRRTTIIGGCVIFMIGVILQTAATGWKLLVAGRAIAGIGIGFVSAVIIMYMSEIAPRKIRGALVSGYQFCITIGLLLASCVTYGTQNRTDTSSYRIPIALQFLWAIILAVGLFLLPESPRYYVAKERPDRAAKALSRIRGQPEDSHYIVNELAEITANFEHERALMPKGGYFSTWSECFKGGLRRPNANLRLTILGTSMQMMQQWTGVNFVFYFGTVFFQDIGTIKNPFLISLVTTLVNVCSTPISFWTVERFGRRPLLIGGAAGMFICELIVAAIGTAMDRNATVAKVQIAFICIYIFFFASTWGPAAWVVIGEIFPIPIRSRGVALSTASNWLWNCIIAVITPYLVDPDKANLRSKVFWIWSGTCGACLVYAYFLVWETKGLTLEQVDQMMEECKTPRKSPGWRPTTTFVDRRGSRAVPGTEKHGLAGTHDEVMTHDVSKAV